MYQQDKRWEFKISGLSYYYRYYRKILQYRIQGKYRGALRKLHRLAVWAQTRGDAEP